MSEDALASWREEKTYRPAATIPDVIDASDRARAALV
jgi:hypothetical protein